MLRSNLTSINDREGSAVPSGLPEIIDAHVHAGFDEISAYKKLIEKYDNLRLDTTMLLSDYFPPGETIELDSFRFQTFFASI